MELIIDCGNTILDVGVLLKDTRLITTSMMSSVFFVELVFYGTGYDEMNFLLRY